MTASGRSLPSASSGPLISVSRPTALASVSARRRRLRGRGFSSADAAELCQPFWSREHGGKETGNTQVDVQAFPVQATTLAKDLDRSDILGTSSPEIWYQPHGQRDRSAVRELDPQCTFFRAVHGGARSRLRFCCTSPSAGRPSEILPQLLLYPSSRRV